MDSRAILLVKRSHGLSLCRTCFRSLGRTLFHTLCWKLFSAVMVCWLTLSFGLSRVSAEEPMAVATESPEAEVDAGAAEFFETRIRPLLSRHCWECHGAEKQENGLRLDHRAGWFGESSTGEPLLLDGRLGGVIWDAVRRTGPLEMPPDTELEEAALADLQRWFETGLPWPADGDVDPAVIGLESRVERHRADHWAFQPVRRPTPSGVNDPWCQTGLDTYVLAKLHEAGLQPSPRADVRTLVRRVSFDLHGLPPTLDQVQKLERDYQPPAYARLIESLLASPRYGERWGRHWLDVARYADTQGYAFARDRSYPFAYTYRDYVIRSFNEDLPYDQFVREQLAADLLPSPRSRESLAALGFLTVGRRYINSHDTLDDRIDVVSRGLLGLTVSCARCHDHKYDAIPTEDYYSLYGIFASCHEPGELPVLGDPEFVNKYEQLNAAVQEVQARRGKLVNQHLDRLRHEVRTRMADYLVAVVLEKQGASAATDAGETRANSSRLHQLVIDRWRDFLDRRANDRHATLKPWFLLMKLDDRELPDELPGTLRRLRDDKTALISPLILDALERAQPTTRAEVARVYGEQLTKVYLQWRDLGGDQRAFGKLPDFERQLGLLIQPDDTPTMLREGDLDELLSAQEIQQLEVLQEQLQVAREALPPQPRRAMVLLDNAQPVEPVVFLRGDPARRGNAVPRRFLQVLSDSEQSAAFPEGSGSGRLELAEAVTAKDNPLAARVIVNRVWLHFFGEPLVDSPSDFGVRTAAPVHQELLDYLAWNLVQHDWSLKWLHGEILNSAAYQQASSGLAAESAVIDPDNRLWGRVNRRRLDFEALRDSLLAVSGRLDLTMGGPAVDIFAEQPSPRRTIYAHIDRQDLPNVFRAFDLASPDQSTARRSETTVPQQALYLLNSPFVLDQAEQLVARLQRSNVVGLDARVDWLYATFFQRSPTPAERELARQFVVTGGSPAADSGASSGANSGASSEANSGAGGTDAALAGGTTVGDADTETAADDAHWTSYVQLLMLTNEFSFVD